MHAHAGCGLCHAADRRVALCRATRRRARADARAAKRDPLELPLRFHGELFWRAEGRQRSDAMSERQRREAFLRLSAGGEGGHAGAGSQASGTTCHSFTRGACALRFATRPGAGCSRRCDTAGPRSCRCFGARRASRSKTGGTGCIDAARGVGTAGSGQTGSAGSEERRETPGQRATGARRPACRDRRCPTAGVCLGTHQVPGGVPRSLLRRGYRGRPRGRLPAGKRRAAFTDLPKRPGRVGSLTLP